jgi:hypothetical protein
VAHPDLDWGAVPVPGWEGLLSGADCAIDGYADCAWHDKRNLRNQWTMKIYGRFSRLCGLDIKVAAGNRPQRKGFMISKKFLVRVLMGTLVIVGVGMAFGLGLVGCDTDNGDEPYDGPKTIVITGFNLADKEGFGVEISLGIDGAQKNIVADAANVESPSGQITLALRNRKKDSEGNKTPWTGTGNYYIRIMVWPGQDAGHGSNYYYSVNGSAPTPFDIRSAVTTLKWSDFTYTGEYTPG